LKLQLHTRAFLRKQERMWPILSVIYLRGSLLLDLTQPESSGCFLRWSFVTVKGAERKVENETVCESKD